MSGSIAAPMIKVLTACNDLLFVRIWRSSSEGGCPFFSYGMTVVKYCKPSQQRQKETGDKSTAVDVHVGLINNVCIISVEKNKMKFSRWKVSKATCRSLHPLPKVCRKLF